MPIKCLTLISEDYWTQLSNKSSIWKDNVTYVTTENIDY